ncbi:hypothetical protein ABZ815_39165 [Nonomuraea sp. NPDC047529]|uniref:hypothetical protein n=1 Tax=Nonomuraea sp. NPDC047529 TaxID=3155623 RepID=UPI0033EDF13F
MLGVLLGTGGTLLGQYLATRVDNRRLEHDQLTTMRAERKAAILSFLDAAQRIELILDSRSVSKNQSDEIAAHEDLHKLWLAKKTVELVCSSELAQCAHSYTQVLHVTLRDSDRFLDSDARRQSRYSMMESARKDLGITGNPLVRDLPPGQLSND